MTKIISLFLFVLSFNAFAVREYIATIEKVDLGTNGEPHLLLLSDGYVLKVDSNEKSIISYYQKASTQKKILRFKINDEREVISSTSLGKEKTRLKNYKESASGVYTPTVLGSITEAQTIFRNLRRGARSNSQCYSRAHIWSYESKSKYNLNSMKVFVFYTRKYIRQYNFYWWFHVSPFTYVSSEGETQERVLDFKFTKGPLPMKNWTDIFMRNKVTCPVITKYSQYENHQESNYCYLFKESMYYFQPVDLKNIERYGREKFNWFQYEIRRAYSNGFGL